MANRTVAMEPPMTQQEFDHAVRENDGKKLVEYMWRVQDDNEYMNFAAYGFSEHGKIVEIIVVPRTGDLQAISERMSSALRRSTEAMERHGEARIHGVADMDGNHDHWTTEEHEKWIKENLPKAEPGAHTVEPRSTAPKVGRNEPCPCGSGKKYKRCCGGVVN